MARDYSPNDMLHMQQEAMRRVQEMQAKAQRTLQYANGQGSSPNAQPPQRQGNMPPPVSKELEERIRQNDAPRSQQHGPKHTRLPVELPRNITTQTTIPRVPRQEAEEHPPEPPAAAGAPQAEAGQKPDGPGQQKQPGPQAQHQRMQGPMQRGSLPSRGGMGHSKQISKPSGGLATLFSGGGDLIKRLMADQDLLLILGMVWLLSDEKADQSLLMALLYIIM